MNIFCFLWNLSNDVLRCQFNLNEFTDIIIPFVILRRLDCILEEEEDARLKYFTKSKYNIEELIKNRFTLSKYNLKELIKDKSKLSENLYEYIGSFSQNIQDIFKNFEFNKYIARLEKSDSLYLLIEKFTEIDLHPSKVDNHLMGTIFEELLRKFSEMSNETSGEHYTPRDVVTLLVSLVFSPDKEKLSVPNKIISIYDPCCGTGGMLTVGKEWVNEHISKNIDLNIFGQELNPQTYSICKAEFLITDREPENIKLGNTLTEDKFPDKKFDYIISNPPYGVSWKKNQKQIENESKDFEGRFSVGVPRVSDSSLLFLQHMISKMESEGSRVGVVFSGSPLFTGDAGSGESKIRKWIIENDWLETIVSLPDKLFFNTGIPTYIWIITNNKSEDRKGKIQLIDASKYFHSMRKNLGVKGKEINNENRNQILRTYLNFKENEICKIFDNEYFGYTKVVIERPLIEDGKQKKDKQGNPKPDTSKRDKEYVPLSENIDEYYKREVKPHLPDSWMDRSKDKIGYEINFTKYFYKSKPLRSTEEIEQDLLKLEEEVKNRYIC